MPRKPIKWLWKTVEGGAARFFSDDEYVFGPPAAVFRAYLTFEEALCLRCGVCIQRKKTGVYYLGERHPSTPEGLKRAGVEIDGVFHARFQCIGMAIRPLGCVENFLNSKVEEISQVIYKTVEILTEDLKAM